MIYNEQFKPEAVLLVKDAQVLKVLIHPLRTRILGLLAPKAMTVKELASELGLEPSRLYYHTKLLLQTGLIVAVGERRQGNLTELSYRARALDFDASPILASKEGGSTAFEERIASVADLMAASIKASARDMGRLLEARAAAGAEGENPEKKSIDLIIRMMDASLGPETYKAFVAKLNALMDDFAALPAEPAGQEAGEARNYVLSLGFYPQAGSIMAGD